MKKQKIAYHELQKETTDTRKQLGDKLDDADKRLERVLERLREASDKLKQPALPAYTGPVS